MKTFHRPRPDRCLGFESLENRLLMAGNVQASVQQGALLISGDDNSNFVQVKQLSGKKWEVQGLATKINGKNSSFIAKGVIGISAELGGGHDFFKAYNSNLEFGLNVFGGSGNDVVQIMNFKAYGIYVDSGAGSDSILATNVTATDALSGFAVLAGSGHDALTMDRVNAGSVGIDMGDGNDVAVISRTTVKSATDAQFAWFRLAAGSGTDTVQLSSVNVQKQIYIDMGSGNSDSLTVLNSRAKKGTFLGGGNTGDVLVRASNSFNSQTVSGFKVVV